MDGSFSTNYLTLGMSYAKFRLDTTSGPRIGSVLGGWGFSAEYRNYRQVGSVLTLIPGQADSLLLARFGTRELSGKVWWQPAWLNSCRLILVCWLSPSSRLAAVTVGLDNWGKLGPDGPLQFEVEGFRRFGGTDVRHNRRGGSASLKWLFFNEESGLLLRRYQGSNYYNINFEEPAEAFWMIGLTFEHGRQRTFGQYRKPNSTS